MKKIITILVLFAAVALSSKAQTVVFTSIYQARITTAGGLTGTTPVDSGKIIQVSGTVYGPNSYPTPNGMAFWLNDGTAGIKVYSKHVYADYPTLHDGDSITVVGYLTDFYGGAEIDLSDTAAADTIIYNSADTIAPPLVILPNGFSPQTYGQLVQVNNVNMTTATKWLKVSGKHAFTAKASDGLYIYVDSFVNAAMYNHAQPRGIYNVVGIGDDYSPTEFNIDPRSMADFILVVADTTTGINNIENLLTAAVYPNPASTQVMVKFNSESEQPMTSKMFDVTGREVVTETGNAIAGDNTVELNTAALTNGMYILEVRVGDKMMNTKIIVSK